MFLCDLCRKEIKKGDLYFTLGKEKSKHVHDSCIKLCKEIIKHPKLSDVKLIYLNEYLEKKEQGLI